MTWFIRCRIGPNTKYKSVVSSLCIFHSWLIIYLVTFLSSHTRKWSATCLVNTVYMYCIQKAFHFVCTKRHSARHYVSLQEFEKMYWYERYAHIHINRMSIIWYIIIIAKLECDKNKKIDHIHIRLFCFRTTFHAQTTSVDVYFSFHRFNFIRLQNLSLCSTFVLFSLYPLQFKNDNLLL